MIKDLLGIKKKRPSLPMKERKANTVSSRRFNDMIDYYTAELKSRLTEIKQMKEENEMLIKTSIRSAAHSDENRLHAKKLQEDNRVLRQKLDNR
ncbi:hypothetical protein ACFL3V_06815 [Nanoarchaeota archaeon]